MSTAFYTDPACLNHATPEGHPEQVARLVSILAALEHRDFAGLDRRQAPMAEVAELLRCHPQDYIDRIRAAEPDAGNHQLDADTWMSPGSWAAALAGVGAVTAALDAVVAGEARNAFAAIRPPGHHAETATPMGFCLFGTVAIAAKRALDHHGLSRVAVLDFDVHHGNGTQDLLWDEPRALFVSSHQFPLWPGTGRAEETGPHGTILNVPLAPGTRGPDFRDAWEGQVFPRLDIFKPELILISAGFDAHIDDPLAQLALTEEDFIWITHRICDLADAHAGGRVVSALEGGYNLDALAASTAAHIRVLMERGA
ncbi:histone deacetylase family protein [Pararhodobacter zhoushanensis]|uniref:histone deacetylase family protein n=1 Tax=Pararhodobacter zhoushanensis TaxID=2479545 RepID=UPI000F8EA9AD|nr:histone deacetylase family protein [Pararhodobacter zhoushanensis]